MAIELEDLNDFRFYALKIKWKRRCTCGGHLKMFRDKGTIFEICPQPDCRKIYDITRECSYCERKHEFEDITCDTCEKKVINITTAKVTIEECSKAIKKINRAYKNGLLEERDWRDALNINQEEKDLCIKSLDKLKKEIGIEI